MDRFLDNVALVSAILLFVSILVTTVVTIMFRDNVDYDEEDEDKDE